ncbi:hypothetical protein PHYBOEH_007135 [Phytophthora boehmeriae]|uniref:Uncharacterized protein n=1 Tax=Phytophthora boehmeriae TaxID=109152 RepID=A0A8T1X1U1_9STRA|nr:hypothetical protein PHYBOEH_007135 [Phytophthora boehmeriae]
METQAALSEVIEISSDESDDEQKTENHWTESLPWSSVVTRLLALAKDRDLPNKTHEISVLLQELHIPPSIDVCCALQDACEELGRLMEVFEGRARRSKANEALAVVLCEVLSLAQTLPVGIKTCMEQDVDLTDPMQDMLLLMDKWSNLLAEIRATSDGRQRALNRTMAWLEAMIAQCKSKLRDIEEVMKVEADKQYQHQWQTLAMLKRQKREVTHRSLLFKAVLRLACVVAQQASAYQSIKNESSSAVNKLGIFSNDVLHFMNGYCDELQDIMYPSQYRDEFFDGTTPSTEGEDSGHLSVDPSKRRVELLDFITRLELFWSVHKTQLPPPVLEVVSQSFIALVKANMKTACPITSAVDRVSEELWATYDILKGLGT